MDFDAAFGGFGDAGQNLQEGALARSIAADDADDFASSDLERDGFERPYVVVPSGARSFSGAIDRPQRPQRRRDDPRERIAQGVVPGVLRFSDAKPLSEAVYPYRDVVHSDCRVSARDEDSRLSAWVTPSPVRNVFVAPATSSTDTPRM